jgi:hypothetical protein
MPSSPSMKVMALLHDPGIPVAVVERDRTGLGTQRRDVDADLAFAAHHHREFVVFAVESQLGGAHEGLRSVTTDRRSTIRAQRIASRRSAIDSAESVSSRIPG